MEPGAVIEPIEPAERQEHVDATAKHLRGSSMLLVAKVVAQALEFVAQIILVRFLTKGDYGAFSYALSIVILLRSVAAFEMPHSVSCLIPIFREKKDAGAVAGSIAVGISSVFALGMLIVGAITVGLTVFHATPTSDPQALRLLLIMAVLIPTEAIDFLLTSLYAVFGNAREIMLRQLLVPVMRACLVLAMMLINADVVKLAFGYLGVSIIGTLIYAASFVLMLRRQGVIGGVDFRRAAYPFRQIFGFSLPLLASTLVWLLTDSSDAILLGYFRGTESVANYRVVLPFAQLNQGVAFTFSVLYIPLAAKLFARKQQQELDEFYWRTTFWTALLTFPIFIMTFGFATSMTTTLYGDRYAEAAPIMAILALGYFFHTSLGFNGLTLKVYQKLRYSVMIDIAAVVVNLIVNIFMVSRFGAIGAAVGTTTTLIVHNLLKQYGLWRYTGIGAFNRRCLRFYGTIFAVAAVAVLVQRVVPSTLLVALPIAAVASILVLLLSRDLLDLESIFPEIARIPIARVILKPLMRPT
jgi:O-antigen/teichoic acid export membrane protein